MNKKEVPKSVFQRAGRLLNLARQVGVSEIKQQFSRIVYGEEAALRLRIDQAKAIVHQLGALKGAAMKIGQMLALEGRDYFPPEVLKILDQLQSNTQAFEFKTVEEVFKSELGSKVHDFENISFIPLAAASIGQVHRAVLNYGGKKHDVVIKIQYPGVADSIDADIRVLKNILKTLGFLVRRETDFSGLIDEFTEVFKQESNYVLEAEFTQAYKKNLLESADYIVPTVYHEYSSSKVLVTSYEQGLSFSAWLDVQKPSLDEKKKIAALLLNLYTKEFCLWGLVQTDPNLGNFLIPSDASKIILLDFGATKAYDISFRTLYAQLVMAACEKNDDAIATLAHQMGLLDPRESPKAHEIFCSLMKQSMEPMLREKYSFKETPYMEQIRSLTRKLVLQLRYSAPPKDLIFLHRKLTGVFFILKFLEVEMDLRVYLEEFRDLLVRQEVL